MLLKAKEHASKCSAPTSENVIDRLRLGLMILSLGLVICGIACDSTLFQPNPQQLFVTYVTDGSCSDVGLIHIYIHKECNRSLLTMALISGSDVYACIQATG